MKMEKLELILWAVFGIPFVVFLSIKVKQMEKEYLKSLKNDTQNL